MVYQELGFVIINSVNTVKERFSCNLPKPPTSIRILQSFKDIHTSLPMPHILHLLPHAKEEVAACIKQGYDRIHSFGIAVELVVPLDE